MHLGFAGPGAFQQQLTKLFADRIGKGNMRDNSAAKISMLRRTLGSIDKLVDQNNVARFIFFLQRANRADAHDPSDVQFLQRVNISPVIQFGRQETMAPRMSRQENHFTSSELAREQAVRGRAEWCLNLETLLPRKAFNVIQAAAANDPDPIHGPIECAER